MLDWNKVFEFFPKLIEKMAVPLWIFFGLLVFLPSEFTEVVKIHPQIPIAAKVCLLLTTSIVFWQFSTFVFSVFGSLYPVLRTKINRKIYFDQIVNRINHYEDVKKFVLVLAFKSGRPKIEEPASLFLEEMKADGVIEGYSTEYFIRSEIWQHLNHHAKVRDRILNILGGTKRLEELQYEKEMRDRRQM